MNRDRKEFNQFISKTFDEIYSDNGEEEELLVYQAWNYSVHSTATFIKLRIDKESNWKIHLVIWEIGKDTPRLLDPIEKIKWPGQISPSIRKENIPLANSEKAFFERQINQLSREEFKEFERGYTKKLKICIPNGVKNFAWNDDLEIDNLITELINKLEERANMR